MNLFNYVLSHAEFAVQLRMNRAQRKVDGASFKCRRKRDVRMIDRSVERQEFLEGVVEESTFRLGLMGW